jgi:hypothetical protein
MLIPKRSHFVKAKRACGGRDQSQTMRQKETRMGGDTSHLIVPMRPDSVGAACPREAYMTMTISVMPIELSGSLGGRAQALRKRAINRRPRPSAATAPGLRLLAINRREKV